MEVFGETKYVEETSLPDAFLASRPDRRGGLKQEK
jgi:hypothetical protein